ncbi:MAG: FecR domain-containing protein [Bacteroidia bacterium]|nr:FecR domain-containing protein [Bacteroidia bacterium]
MKQDIDINQISAEELRTLEAIRSRKECIWQNICRESGIASQESDKRVFKMSRRVMTWMSVAASVVVLLSLGALFNITTSNIDELGGDANILTAATDRTSSELEDGSVVRLAQGSTMRYDVLGERRVVVLEGQASFSVKRDEDRPFVVYLEGRDSKVEVLGTSFVVENLKDRERYSVKVKSGNVRVSTPRGEAELIKGEKVLVENGNFEKMECSKRAIGDWDSNKLELKEATLREAVSELMDIYPEIKRVEEKEEGLIEQNSGILVTSKFDNEPLEKVLKELSIHFGIKIEIVGGSLTLSR